MTERCPTYLLPCSTACSRKVKTTLDSIKNVKLYQSEKGYRFSVDALLLEDFISVKGRPAMMEFGTGSGVISLIIAKRLPKSKIVAVEIQESLAALARENVRQNRLEDRIDVLHADIRSLGKRFSPCTFDCIFTNPPFRAMRSGRLNTDREKAVARHEIEISLPDIVRTASRLLKNGGRFYLVYHPFRLVELVVLLRTSGLEPKRMRFVHSRNTEEAKMALIESVKGSGQWLTVEPPFYIYGRGGEYSEGMERIYSDCP